jgi:hypothetical protein
VLQGEVPSPLNPPRGCRLHPRCVKAFGDCAVVEPLLQEIEGGALGGVSSPLTERSVRSRAMIYIRSVRRRSLPIASAGAGLISTAF